mgnify:CR=1 FL=1
MASKNELIDEAMLRKANPDNGKQVFKSKIFFVRLNFL